MSNSPTRRDAFASAAALALGVAAVAAAPTAALSADQQNMRNALASLEDARRSLQAAAQNKGGHRAKALELVSKAIGEVREGIRYAEG